MRYPAGFVPRQLFSRPVPGGELRARAAPGRRADRRPRARRPWSTSARPRATTPSAWRCGSPAARRDRVRARSGVCARRPRAARERNGVADRLELRGLCTVAELAGARPALTRPDRGDHGLRGRRERARRPDRGPVAARRLAADRASPGDRRRRPRRASATGSPPATSSRIPSTEIRRASLFDAELRPIRGLRRIDRELLVAEFRDGPQDWLVATPR